MSNEFEATDSSHYVIFSRKCSHFLILPLQKYNSVTYGHISSDFNINFFIALWSNSCGATFQQSLFVFEMRRKIWGSLRETKDQAFVIRIRWKMRLANRYLWTPLAN